jgi:hypothetical protein
VSYYALFQGWLLLSQPPGCRRAATTLPTQPALRDLSRRSGLFPSRRRNLAPAVSLPRSPRDGIRRLVRVGKRQAPAPIRPRYLRRAPPERRYLNTFRGEPAISGFAWHFTSTHRSSRWFAIHPGAGLHERVPPASPCPWVAHPVSGRVDATLHEPPCRDPPAPFRTRVRSGSGCPRLSLAAPTHSSAHSTKGTPSPVSRLRPARGARFQALFHSPHRGAFHRSLTVLVPYRSSAVFSLGRWSAPLPTRFRVSGGTHARNPPAPGARRLRGSHPLRPPVPAAFGCAPSHRRGVRRPLRSRRSTPGRQRQRAPFAARVWAPPRSLAATGGILSFPPGTEMFQFPGCPPHKACGDRVRPRPGCPIRTPPDRRLPAPPRGVSPRGRVLHRPPTPRHPPCALLRGIRRPPSVPAPRSPPDPTPTRGGVTRGRSSAAADRTGPRRASSGHHTAPACSVDGPLVVLCVAVHTAGHHRPAAAARPWSVPRTHLSKYPGHAAAPAPVEPRGFEPRTSAVQGRRSPG